MAKTIELPFHIDFLISYRLYKNILIMSRMIIRTQMCSKTTGRIFKGVNIQTCVWVWFRNHITKATFNIRNHPFIVDKRLYIQVTPINWCNLK